MKNNDDARKFKVSELNRILPMVRDTIEKEEYINQIKKELNEKTNLLKTIEKSIINLSELPQLLPDIIQQQEIQFKMIGNSLKKEKEQLEVSITSLREDLEEATYQWKLENTLYKSITSTLVSDDKDGFLLKSEIQHEFLKEYMYLCLLDNSLLKKAQVNC